MQEDLCRHELFTLLEQQEQYWRQRSRATWIKDGDRYKKCFHRWANFRNQKNRI